MNRAGSSLQCRIIIQLAREDCHISLPAVIEPSLFYFTLPALLFRYKSHYCSWTREKIKNKRTVRAHRFHWRRVFRMTYAYVCACKHGCAPPSYLSFQYFFVPQMFVWKPISLLMRSNLTCETHQSDSRSL